MCGKRLLHMAIWIIWLSVMLLKTNALSQCLFRDKKRSEWIRKKAGRHSENLDDLIGDGLKFITLLWRMGLG